MRPRPMRRGSALILVLMMTLAIAGLSIAAIFLSSSSSLLAASYDRERSFRLAALAALEMARDSIQRYALIDTIPAASAGPMQLYSGVQVRDATGAAVPGVSVNVYAAMTGDTLGGILPTVTLVAQAYDAFGVRHVQRMDLRPEAFSHFAMFVDDNVSHGPGVVGGRAHANGNWTIADPGAQLDNIFLDTLSATGSITDQGSGNKAATLVRGSAASVPVIEYPRDSTFAWMQSAAGAAGLDLNLTNTSAALGGGTNLGGSRVELVAYDADGDGLSEAGEGFLVVVDMVAGYRARRAVEPVAVFTDPVLQHQCGAFYRRPTATAGVFRWHFLPVSAHRRAAFQTLIQSTATGSLPSVSSAVYTSMTEYSAAGLKAILDQPTARCFPVGSPYLMPSERFTRTNTLTHSGSGNPFSTPWGGSSATPAGGWYGGSDTTYSGLLKTCTVQANGSCQGGTIGTIAALRPFGGTLGASQLADSALRRYLWPLRSPYNGSATNKSLANVRVAANDTLYLSGVLRGRLTMRVDGGVVLPDRLRYAQDPNDPNTTPCENTLGLLAVRDILVGHGAAARIYDVGSGVSNFTLRGGGEARFTIHGFLMSLTGAVGVLGNNLNFGATSGAASQLSCPEDETTSKDDSNGGCFAITGGIAMNTYRPFYVSTGGGSTKNGMRYSGTWDRCSESGGRPPYYPVTTRVFVVRTLEVGASRANTPGKVSAYLQSLLGKPL